MSDLRPLYARFRHLIHEGARFGVVGLAGLMVTDGGTDLLRYQAGLDRVSSLATASLVATAITFAGSRYWTYRHRERTGDNASRTRSSQAGSSPCRACHLAARVRAPAH